MWFSFLKKIWVMEANIKALDQFCSQGCQYKCSYTMDKNTSIESKDLGFYKVEKVWYAFADFFYASKNWHQSCHFAEMTTNFSLDHMFDWTH